MISWMKFLQFCNTIVFTRDPPFTWFWLLIPLYQKVRISCFLLCKCPTTILHYDGLTYKKVMARYANPLLLIIDEWLLLKPNENERKDIFELLHRRRKKSSTVFCSQYRAEGWYEQLGGNDGPLADAILDRIVHDAYKINIESIDPARDLSMREVYGLDKTLSE
jgi:hypothetical protein